jgi:hypothetical protein
MRTVPYLAVCVTLLTGCGSPERARQPADTREAVADLNRQIEKFNAERPGDMGITPIAQRVLRIELTQANETVNCYDASGGLFLVLSRQPDGEFKGTLKVPYHELPKPEGHSWGHAIADFTLRPEVFQPKELSQ